MPKVLISDKLNPLAVEIFEKSGIDVDFKPGLSPEEQLAIIDQYDGLAIRSSTTVTEEMIVQATNLKVVGRAGIGVDNVDIPAATAKGVVVMNTPFGNSITTAEHAISMMMALARQTADLGVEKVELDELFKRADFITIHVPKNEHTAGLINKDALLKMKDGVRIINCARGGIIVEADLKDALDSGKVAGAALDVFEVEPATENALFGHDKVICTPHLGAATTEAQVNVAIQVMCIRDSLTGGRGAWHSNQAKL